MAELGINHFISNITEGLASPNKYEVQFTRPTSLGGSNDPSISVMCNVASLPGRSIKTYENRHYGVPFKLPYSAEYQDISFSFITQLGFKERKFFDTWQEHVINPETGLLEFYNNYIGTIRIKHLSGKDGSVDYYVKLFDVYPVAIQEIALGYSMSNEALISSVTFTYRNWEDVGK